MDRRGLNLSLSLRRPPPFSLSLSLGLDFPLAPHIGVSLVFVLFFLEKLNSVSTTERVCGVCALL